MIRLVLGAIFVLVFLFVIYFVTTWLLGLGLMALGFAMVFFEWVYKKIRGVI